MVFSSFIFIFGFLPVVLSIYFLSPSKLRNLILLISSFLFYAWGAPFISLMLFVGSVFDFYLVKIMSEKSGKSRTHLTYAAVSLNIAFLAYYKYANFFVSQITLLTKSYGIDVGIWNEIVLPIGISFFTFHKISYIVDVYRKTTLPAKSFLEYFLYILFFPQLIAGPILRYKDLNKQIEQRDATAQLFIYGVVRFFIGLSKKVLLADAMGAVAENVFSLPLESRSTSYAWIGALSYTYQIYFDFSGYSDMAIGLCAMFGFKISENFNMPYRSSSVTEFWKRWHISLSSWMKDYLYIPLGGNRMSEIKNVRNLWIVFIFSGLWHGANWTFLIWGALHGLLMSTERFFISKINFPVFVGRFYTLIFILLTWVIFRSDSMQTATQYFQSLFFISTPNIIPVLGLIINERGRFIFIVSSLIIALSWHNKFSGFIDYHYQYPLKRPAVLFIFSYILFLLSVLTLSTSVFSPFIYYQF